MEHELSVFEIADALFKAGLHAEYKAMRHFINERDAMLERIETTLRSSQHEQT